MTTQPLDYQELRTAIGEGAKSATRLASLMDGAHSPREWRDVDRVEAINAARKLHALLLKLEAMVAPAAVDSPAAAG